MHNAPAVSYPVGRCRFQTVALIFLLMLMPLAVGAWQSQSVVGDALTWVSWATVVLVAGFALASWWRTPTGMLRWDGSQWTWQGVNMAPIPGRVAVCLDWQRGMLLEFHADAANRAWLWMAQSRDPAAWLSLRRAAFAELNTAAAAGTAGGAA